MNTQNESVSMTNKPLVDQSFDTSLGAVIFFILAGPIIFVLWGLFTLIDSSFLPLNSKEGRVIDKTFIPEYMGQSTEFNNIMDPASSHLTYFPKKYSVCVEVDGKQDSISVSEDLFNSINEGDLLMAKFITGRFSGGLYLKALSQI